MKATEVLSSEHRIIETVLRAFKAAADDAERGNPICGETFRQSLRFFKSFADGCHHRKEEDVLFPALVRLGMPENGGPVGTMLAEHHLMRSMIRSIADNLDDAVQGREAARRIVLSAAKNYVETLTAHIQKEDHCLFAMANSMMPPAEQQQVLKAFEDLEDGHEAGLHESLVALAKDLGQKWGVEVPETVGHGCCGH